VTETKLPQYSMLTLFKQFQQLINDIPVLDATGSP